MPVTYCLPLGQLTETLLTGPDGCVNNLQEQLSSSGVENKDGTVDGLGRQVTLERLVDGDSVHVGVVDEPDDLVGEELRVIATVQVRFCRFRGIQLQGLSDTFTQDEERGVGLHDLAHGLGDQRLETGGPVTVRRVQVVGQIDGDEDTGR